MLRFVKIPEPIQPYDPMTFDDDEPKKLVRMFEPLTIDGKVQMLNGEPLVDPSKPVYWTPFTIQKFNAQFIFSNPYLGDDGTEAGERMDRLRLAFARSDVFEVDGVRYAAVEDADIAAVLRICDKPDGDGSRTSAIDKARKIVWPTVLTGQLMAFPRAYRTATDVDPRKVAAEKAAAEAKAKAAAAA